MIPAIRARLDARARFLRQRDAAAHRAISRRHVTNARTCGIVLAAANRQRREQRWRAA